MLSVMGAADTPLRLNAALEGRYRIERELGEGGMATVYLARDLKHNRNVALKVLKPELAAVVGAERFLAEIETTANLQHPHILPLFDSGQADSFLFYVMPYLEGETLRQRIDREHQLPVDEAVKLAINVAEALQYAHAHGVVHRDIKPANILLQAGKPVVSDFGIALALSMGGAGRLTETGLSLGTPHYMSPEQATGDASIGPATDLWALACMLYEMLVGEPPYTGSTPQAVLGRIVTGSASPLREHRKTVPPNVDAAVRRALEKVPADRFPSVEAFAQALTDPTFRHGETGDATAAAGARGLWNPLSMATSLSTVLLAVVSAWAMSSREPPAGVRRLDVLMPAELILPSSPGRALDVSRDGSILLLGASPDGLGRVWLRRIDRLDPSPIPGTEGGQTPRFSPDGEAVAYRVGQSIRVNSLQGGLGRTLVESGAARDLEWGEDGWIYFGNASGAISRVPGDGGEVEVVTTLAEGEVGHGQPQVLPGGRGLLFTRNTGDLSATEVVLAPREGGVRTLIRGRAASYSPTGHIVFATAEGRLFAAGFDLDRLEIASEPTDLGVDVRVLPSGLAARYALSETGWLAYEPGDPVGNQRLVWVDRAGNEESVDIDLPAGAIVNNRSLALSPSDDRLAVSLSIAGEIDLWVKELPDGPLTGLTRSVGQDRAPVWRRDGRTIVYSWYNNAMEGEAGEVREIRADGSSEGAHTTVLDRVAAEIQLTRDERVLIFREGNSTNAPDPRDREGDIGALDIRSGEVRVPLFPSDYIERSIALSPDDRLLAYVSNSTGADEVYVRPWPNAEESRFQVSTAGGSEPVFAHSGRELFYREPGGAMIVVTYVTEPAFQVVGRARLFDASPYEPSGGPWHAYALSQDDQRFLMIRVRSDYSRLVLVENFLQELRGLALD